MQISIVDYFCVYISNASDQCFKIEEDDVIINIKFKERNKEWKNLAQTSFESVIR